MSDPKEIYLEPVCAKCGDQGGDRQWCADDVWGGDPCDGCGGGMAAIKYILPPKVRTLKQNRLYWKWVGEVVTAISEYTGYEKDEVHNHFKSCFLPGKHVEIGGRSSRYNTTTTLTTQEMSAYSDRIYRFAKIDVGVELTEPPEPDFEERYAQPNA